MSIRMILKQIRLDRNLSLRELQTITDVSKTELSYIENEKIIPRLDIACKIAKGLDIPITDLYVETDEPHYYSDSSVQEYIKM